MHALDNFIPNNIWWQLSLESRTNFLELGDRAVELVVGLCIVSRGYETRQTSKGLSIVLATNYGLWKVRLLFGALWLLPSFPWEAEKSYRFRILMRLTQYFALAYTGQYGHS